MLTARDYTNNEYPLLATKIHTSELNGQDDLELRIPQQKNNNLDLLAIDKLWEFDYNNITYKAVNVKRQTRGNSFNLNVRAMPLFYWEFSKSIIHTNFNGSMTAVACFTRLFEGTGYNFSLINPSPAVSWEGFGKGSSRLELFKRAIERYNYEFYIEGRTVYLRHLIGNDTNFMYKYKLNASNVSSTTDASGYFTHIKGFGNFEESEEDYFNNAKLKREFTHPLTDIVGEWEGAPIVDGRITVTDTMDTALIKAVEESLAITIEGTLHDVRKIYDIAVPVKGDRVWLHDERINLEQEIRLHKIVTTYDEKDNVIACDVTFGSQSIRDRHKSNLSAMAQAISDLLDGKIELPYDILAPRAKEMLAKIMSVDTELVLDNGIFAVDPNNPNNIVGLNSAGWFISTDGGATAQTIATADGIVANSITSGELLTHLVRIVGTDGFMWMDGNEFVAMNPLDDKQFVRISPQTGLTVSKGSLNILSGSGENAVTVWDSAEDNAKLHADTVAETAENNAKGHADTVAGTAEQNAKDHADDVDDNLRNDLQMTSPLPNELELSTNGITAYNNSNDRFARLDYRGLFIDGGAVQIRGRDKRELMIDGIMRGQRVANIIHFNSNPDIEWNNMNWVWTGEESHTFYFIDDQYQGNFIDLAIATNIKYDSPAASAYVDVNITQFNGTVVASGRYFVQRSSSESNFTRLRVDLKELYGVVPDYRTVSLYVKAQITVNPNAIATFRVNKGSFYD